jgi:hypothetical protein
MVKILLMTLFSNLGELSMSELNSVRSKIRVTDLEIHKFLWNSAERQPRFPVYKIRSGKEYSGLEETLQKPHGFRRIMEEALKYLQSTRKRRWKSFLNKLTKEFNEYQIIEMVELLIQTGIVCLTEKNNRPFKGEYWDAFEISVDPRAIKELEIKYGSNNEKEKLRNSTLIEIQQLVDQWGKSDADISRKLEKLVQLGIKSLLEPNAKNEFPINPTYTISFRSVLITLGYGRLMLGRGETIPLRTLSSLLWDNTKILNRYQAMIEAIIDCPLNLIGIESHPDTIWVYGDIYYHLPGLAPVSLLAGRPTILTRETILESNFTAGTNLKSVLVVENLTVFLTVLRRIYYKRNDVLVLWSDGYWNRLHRKILRSAITQQKVPVYVWSDLDGDGLAITQQICNWVKQHGSKSKPVLMGANDLLKAGGKRVATQRDLTLISNMRSDYFYDLIPLIKEHKLTVEQERLLLDFEYISTKLP